MNVNEVEKNSNKTELSIEELEKLNYYDLFAHLNIPFFNIGGRASIDQLAEMCHVNQNSHILEVGCGTGDNAFYLAEKFGCKVIGIDVSDHMIQKARERAESIEYTDKVIFEIGNAYNLRFADGSFDAVITIFVSHFLDIQKSFKEFTRVLKQGGFIGVNEMYKMDEIPEESIKKIIEAEENFSDLVQLPFKLYTPQEWKFALEINSYKNIFIEHDKIVRKKGSLRRIIHDMGGYKKLFGLLGKAIKLAWKSKPIRHKFSTMNKVKKILLRRKATSKYVGYILVAGQKS
ncbi:MAG: class I SAM-dependent methyltransferase [Candidatus Lokiarchaeota archaeon]|nr:class I SAM-dependent methyltransferase [Candidatus Lokiarchaeota archaeon]